MPAVEQIQHSEPAAASLSSSQIALLTGVCEDDLMMLVDYGFLKPTGCGTKPFTFDVACVDGLKRAVLVRTNLALDSHGFAMAVNVLNNIAAAKAHMQATCSDQHAVCGIGDMKSGCSPTNTAVGSYQFNSI